MIRAAATHVHADHRSGGRAIAARTGARYCLHRAAEVTFDFEPLDDDQVIELGNTIVRIVHTPGHTPESISLVVSDLRRGPEPWFVCTGDTLFVGAVEFPDLPGHERENAAALHHSVRDRLLALADDVEIYPAHFAGSACGAGIAASRAARSRSSGAGTRSSPSASLGIRENLGQPGRDRVAGLHAPQRSPRLARARDRGGPAARRARARDHPPPVRARDRCADRAGG